MKISAKAEYACLALLDLFLLQGHPNPIRVAEIARRNGIPERFLVQILLQLKGAGYVLSVRGAAGGYRFAVDPAQVTLFDIIQLIDGPQGMGTPGIATRSGASWQVLRDVWQDINEGEVQRLREVRFSELMRLAAQRESLMFHI